MKRSGFKKKPYAWKKKPYTWKVKKDKPKKGLFDHLKKESRVEESSRIIRDILDPYFESIGLLNTCELRIPNVCIGNVLRLTYAHSKKRDLIAKEEPERTRELCEVVRACVKCHNKIEHLPDTLEMTGHERMYKIVTDCIARRNEALSKWEKIY